MERAGTIMFQRIAGTVIPVSCAILGVIIDNVPVSFMGGQMSPPLLALIPIYLWTLVRPDLMTPMWVFLIGLVEDLMMGGPPGVRAAAFVATWFVVDRQRDSFAGLTGIGAVLGFSAAALVATATSYAVASIYYARLLVFVPFATELAMTVLFYVLIAPALGSIHRRFVGPLRSDF